MWSWYKPPITNWLLLKFINYKQKSFTKKFYTLNWLKLLVAEMGSLYLHKSWQIWEQKKYNFFFKMQNLNFFTLNIPLAFCVTHTSHFDYVFDKKLNKFFWFKLVSSTLLLYLNWNISFFGLKNFDLFLDKRLDSFTTSIKVLLFSLKGDLFLKNFLSVWLYETVFFYNTYYYLILAVVFQKYWFNSNIFLKKKLFYYGLQVEELLVRNKYENYISYYNNYISIQSGFWKWTRFYFNWHYISSTSTQLPKFSTIQFYKFYFYRIYKILNNSFKHFEYKNKKIINEKFDIKFGPKSGIYIWNWGFPILPQYVSKIFYVHNGHWFNWIRIVPAMIGYKFGSFSFTRRILAKDIKILSSFKNIN